jgi:hypothetical protein
MMNTNLVPQIVVDCCRYMLDDKINSDVKNNYEQRVEAIYKFCEEALAQKKSVFRKRK